MKGSANTEDPVDVSVSVSFLTQHMAILGTLKGVIMSYSSLSVVEVFR